MPPGSCRREVKPRQQMPTGRPGRCPCSLDAAQRIPGPKVAENTPDSALLHPDNSLDRLARWSRHRDDGSSMTVGATVWWVPSRAVAAFARHREPPQAAWQSSAFRPVERAKPLDRHGRCSRPRDDGSGRSWEPACRRLGRVVVAGVVGNRRHGGSHSFRAESDPESVGWSAQPVARMQRSGIRERRFAAQHHPRFRDAATGLLATCPSLRGAAGGVAIEPRRAVSRHEARTNFPTQSGRASRRVSIRFSAK